MGTAKAIAKWTKQYTDEAYERLKRRKITYPNVPKKPEHKEPKQIIDPKPLFTSADTIKKMDLNEDSSVKIEKEEEEKEKVLTKPTSPNTSADMTDIKLEQRKRQELIEQEAAEDIAAANEIIKKAFNQMSAENSEVEKGQSTDHAENFELSKAPSADHVENSEPAKVLSTDQQPITRPQSPDSSVNKPLSRNPLGSKDYDDAPVDFYAV
ncbi:uncharacterized protein LOC110913612 [Helianthus annuus]|uniref:uncharacterized protein LOC110913612 n=1 Tax=Helianthus annuus TaxID=4232 RepID=UPI001652E7C9|nr:uncharacterized protein LOC110913612 [Helianthus annuus]